ncbi:hypothetical protein CYY_005322 [Polysphondylium violaceum]|uniref:Uncharacterized protein n=1 Tax=Polysphondylium violaceum TaxID=133409 RepID=A0A8J4PUK3_9MYCE|nr:hypothetical protein CYY_005322 [Polysphondylium violaceum]
MTGIDWNAIESLKRNELQKLCKELKIEIKGTSKNADLIDALLAYKKENIDTSNQVTTDHNDNNNNDTNIKEKEEPVITNITKDSTTSTPKKSNKRKTKDVEMVEETTKEEVENKETIKEKDTIEKTNVNDKTTIIEKSSNEKQQKEKEETQQTPKSNVSIEDNDQTKTTELTTTTTTIDNETMDQDQDGNDDHHVEIQLEEEETLVGLKFRNYQPRDHKLNKYRVEKTKAPPIVDELLARLQLLETNQEIQISFAPKKINWDLKRDSLKKITKLDKLTEKAIYQLIKQKIESSNDEESKAYLLSKNIDKVK